MADPTLLANPPTINYGWTKPVVGGDGDAWGNEINTDLDGIDSVVFGVSGVANAAQSAAGAAQTAANAAQTTANAALPKAGGTMTGAIAGPGNGGAVLAASSPPAGDNSLALATTAFFVNSASSTAPLMDGTAAVGVGATWARADHVHPTDTSRAPASALGNYLPLVGGTLTGELNIASAWPTLTLAKPAGQAQACQILSYSGAVATANLRWQIALGDNSAEGSGNVGSNFIINRYDNNGSYLGNPLTITRSNGNVSVGPGGLTVGGPTVFNGNVDVWGSLALYRFNDASGVQKGWVGWNNGAVELWSDATSANIIFESGGNIHLNANGNTVYTTDTLQGNFVYSTGAMQAVGRLTAGEVYGTNNLYGGTGAQFHVDSSGNVTTPNTVSGGYVTSSGNILANGAVWGYNGLIAGQGSGSGNGYLQAFGGNNTTSGYIAFYTPGGQRCGYIGYISGNTLNIVTENSTVNVAVTGGIQITAGVVSSGYGCRGGTSGGLSGNYFNFNWTGTMQAWVDTYNLGSLAYTSDYRVKRDIAPLSSMWNKVKALNPISFRHKDYTPSDAQPKEDGSPPDPLVRADDKLRWGFVAHELQETLIEDAASGVKDQVDCIQSPNLLAVVAALTKALQEAMTRIEALEAAHG